ncbi:hypothetical protein [uncultured Hymenobacter sp.]|uniref:hypothetical protein n=1 Tax=uncultured Hymenobacter sp. TaxID=170016 RepID=UPI0035CC7768
MLADSGCANGSNYALLGAQRITAWTLVFGLYKSDVDGFPYDVPTDSTKGRIYTLSPSVALYQKGQFYAIQRVCQAY